jgi:hypothetical protein
MDLSTETTTHAPPTTSYISDVSMDPMGRAWISKRLGWSRDEPDPTGMDIIEPEECTSIFEPNQSLPTALAPFNVAFL